MMAGSSLFFLTSYETCCVYVTMAPHYKDFDFKLTSDVEIRQLFKNTGGEDLFLPLVTLWSRSTSNFFALIGRKSDIGWHHFRCTPCLMRKRI